MIFNKTIDEKDYEKAQKNTYMINWVIKEEFKGCLFIYDDDFEKYYNEGSNLNELDDWLCRRLLYGKEA